MSRGLRGAVVCAALLIMLGGCAGTSVDPYAVTCGELRQDSGLADDATAAIASDVRERREKVPLELIESELELVETYCGAGVDASERPGREAYEEQIEYLDPSPERLKGLPVG